MKKLVKLELSYETVGFTYLCECKDKDNNVFMGNILFEIGKKVKNHFNKDNPIFFKKDFTIPPVLVGNVIIKEKHTLEIDRVNFEIEDMADQENHIKLPRNILSDNNLERYGRKIFMVEINTSWEQKSNSFFQRIIQDNDGKNEIIVNNKTPMFHWVKDNKDYPYLFTYVHIDEAGIVNLMKEGESVLKRFKFNLEEEKQKILKQIKGKNTVIHYKKEKGIIYAIEKRKEYEKNI